MKRLIVLTFFLFSFFHLFAAADSVIVPISRQYFHDKIIQEQKLTDRADGKLDGVLHISSNEEINMQVSDVLYRKVNDLRDWVETAKGIPSNNEKVRNLAYIENLVKSFRVSWRSKQINPLEFSALLNNFEQILKGQVVSASMIPYIELAPYAIAKINSAVFFDNKDIKTVQNIVYLKFCKLNPDKILQTIRPFAKEAFADSLVVLACRNNPVQLYSYAQSFKSVEGQLIHRNTNSMVVAVARLSQTPNALFYFPFLDDLLSGKKTVDSIKKFVGDGEKGYDSVGYFKLLVKTEEAYFTRMSPPLRDTPVAMFGANGLREVLQAKAILHFITPINALHEQSNLAVRMRAIDPLTPEELYYMIVLGENDIYTSSYKHSFNRMLQRMGDNPRGDSLLLHVNFDFFKKFIKMAANFNKLDTFLKSMPPAMSEILMKAFVANLDKGNNLEDAVDVADSYSSINDKKLKNTILSYVNENEQKNLAENNLRGKIIYGLLKTIMLSSDTTSGIDLTAEIGIPSIYEISNKGMQDEKGRIVEQVFFYGDEDGKSFFPRFLNAFPAKDWKLIMKKEWAELSSLKGNISVFANRPLNYDDNLDDSAQVHLGNYLKVLGMKPSIVVHRGHSYWLPGTIDRMPGDAKIIVLGSCGGYKNLNQILETSPDAHIISTKEIGSGDINQPIINYLNQVFISGTTLSWKTMWATLTKTMERDPSKSIRESWDDYIPPYKNLGAIFIKAYHKKMENEQMSN